MKKVQKNKTFIRTLWGLNIDYKDTKTTLATFQKIKRQGFSGVEIATAFLPKEHHKTVQSILKDLELKVVTQIHTTGYPVIETDPARHLDDFRIKVEQALDWNPLLINSHSGRDDWDIETSKEFFRKVTSYEASLGNSFNISHETHRQRTLCTHTTTFQIMKSVPDLHYTLDLSHWVLSAERLISTETDPNFSNLLEMISPKLKYLHARVGSPNQIQVIDPQTVDNQSNRDYFYNIWKRLVDANPSIPVNIEYGPYPYAIITPDKEDPIKNVERLISRELKILSKVLSVSG